MTEIKRPKSATNWPEDAKVTLGPVANDKLGDATGNPQTVYVDGDPIGTLTSYPRTETSKFWRVRYIDLTPLGGSFETRTAAVERVVEYHATVIA